MKKAFIAVTIILSLIIIGLSSFIVYDKVLKNDTKKSESKVDKKTTKEEETETEIDVNSDIVKNLVYPTVNSDADLPSGFILKNESVEFYTRDIKILSTISREDLSNNSMRRICVVKESNSDEIFKNVIKILDYSEDNLANGYECIGYDENKIISKYNSMYGPDDKSYKSGYVKDGTCYMPHYYDSETKKYYGFKNCGGVHPIIDSVRKTYRVIMKGEYLYIYDYAMILWEHVDFANLVLFKDYSDYEEANSLNFEESAINNLVFKVKTKDEAQQKLEEQIKNNQANTYVWTFKRQSDGKYYYDSSKWLEE